MSTGLLAQNTDANFSNLVVNCNLTVNKTATINRLLVNDLIGNDATFIMIG
jgi:hypothetical protein